MKPAQNSAASSTRGWSRTARRVASAALLFHLAAVLYTPLTLGGGYPALLGPWTWFRDYATLLFLDHGYRFFAPEPGPTHTLKLVIGRGELTRSIRLPDRDGVWPRLLYHRWFMLGESLSSAADAAVAGAPQFREAQRELSAEIDAARDRAVPVNVRELEEALSENAQQFTRHQQVLRLLVEGLKSLAAQRYQAPEARIVSCRRLIPTPWQARNRSFDPERMYLELDCTDLDALLAAEPEEMPGAEETGGEEAKE